MQGHFEINTNTTKPQTNTCLYNKHPHAYTHTDKRMNAHPALLERQKPEATT